jgi:hypothetical protein
MARQTLVLQVFVASPSDVAEERRLMEGVVAQLNQIWSATLGITYELVKWETNVRPTFATDPQAAINSQIGEDYDVFIGIFWGRLGTATPRATSGTIEEFEKALARRKANGKVPEIMLYFKDAAIPPSKINTEQLQKVLDFKDSLSDKGGLYSVFEDLNGFESSLRAHLSAVAQSFVSNMPFNSLGDKQKDVISQSEEYLDFEEDDYGYIDYFEIYEARQSDMVSAITVINEATIRIGEQLSQRTSEMVESNKDPREAKRLVKRVADDMHSYAETMKNQIALLSAARENAFSALSNALALRKDFPQQNEDLPVLRSMLLVLINGTRTATDGMSGMREAANALPPISKEVNKAKRAVVYELDAFLSEVDSTRSTVTNLIESIDRMCGGNPDKGESV